MARPIKETPILYGEDARRFELRMTQKRVENPEDKRTRLSNYHDFMIMFEAGKNLRLSSRK